MLDRIESRGYPLRVPSEWWWCYVLRRRRKAATMRINCLSIECDRSILIGRTEQMVYSENMFVHSRAEVDLWLHLYRVQQDDNNGHPLCMTANPILRHHHHRHHTLLIPIYLSLSPGLRYNHLYLQRKNGWRSWPTMKLFLSSSSIKINISPIHTVTASDVTK